MKKHNFLQSISIAMMATQMIFAGAAHATSSDGDALARSGTVACSGNYGGSSQNNSRWTIHNLNEAASITLDRMQVYKADGTRVYDSLSDGPAPSATVVPFGDIGPYQTISFMADELIDAGFLPANLPGDQRPVKAIFDWSSANGKRVLTPYVLLTRIGFSSEGGVSRHARDCRSIN